MKLQIIHNNIENCTKCHLCQAIPEGTKPVPGKGKSNAKIMFVGEAPGKDEQLLGEPFVGLAGKFLNKMMTEANINRKDCYITNVVCCNPRTENGSKNRAPTEDEITICKAWLWQQMQTVSPEIIVTLGSIPTKTLLHSTLNKKIVMKNIVGTIFEVTYCDIIFIPCYHPSYLMLHGKKHVETCVNILKMVKKLIEEK